jgi:drug/metabolite transporter (DMT)-like permease
MTTYYASIAALPLGDAVTIGLMQPPLTALMAWLVLGEVFGWRGAAGFTACLAGVLIVAHPPFLFGGGEVWSVLRAVGVGVGVLSTLLGAGELALPVCAAECLGQVLHNCADLQHQSVC